MTAGLVLGRYQLEGRLAAGGMAEIWRARTVGPDGFSKALVVKRILPQLGDDPATEELFKSEARVAARLDHPNLLHVFDFGREADGTLVLVMELVDGTSLRTVARAVKSGKPIDVRVAAKLIALACEGLHAAHELKDATGASQGLIHRDVSPENILVSRAGAVKVADFGIARVGDGPLTDPNVFRGKIGYASPEQIKGDAIDRRSDLWAIGCTLFEVICGEGPFATETQAELASATLLREPRRLEALRRDCPPELAEIVARCLERDPAKRWPDAHSLGAALEHFIAKTGEPIRSSDLGGIFELLGIAPHTVTSQGTPEPKGSAAPVLPTYAPVEPSTFEPAAELAADGVLHPKATAFAQPRPDSDSAVERQPAIEAQPPIERTIAEPLELEPLAVAVEPPAPIEAPSEGSSAGGVITWVVVFALVAALLGAGWTFRHELLARTPLMTPGALFIDSAPTGAQVLVNGEVKGATPWAGQTPADTTVVLVREGYEPRTLRFPAGADWSGTVTLAKKKR